MNAPLRFRRPMLYAFERPVGQGGKECQDFGVIVAVNGANLPASDS